MLKFCIYQFLTMMIPGTTGDGTLCATETKRDGVNFCPLCLFSLLIGILVLLETVNKDIHSREVGLVFQIIN